MKARQRLATSWLGTKGEDHPLMAPRDQIEDVFDTFDDGLFQLKPHFGMHSDISETDEEIRITAELPGMTYEDFDITVDGHSLTIEGEQKPEGAATKTRKIEVKNVY
ncbi:Hsp20/alpha crystallin family protein [Celeribacter arenosi]|uniref:SHSP domain-containing protein n=1 Tax=Celeribacter arenosi TaxID=792649 RepID=A0ABP7KEC2_9RHOB